MKRTVFAKILVNDEIDNGQVLDTLEKQALEMAHCDLEEAICAEADSDSRHERYINYLINWAIEHNDEAFEGCSPACFDEWFDNEGEEDEEFDADYQPDWRLDIAGWHIDENHRLVISDSAAAFNFKVGKILVIEFLDIWGDRQDIGRYKVIDNDGCEITCEKLA